MKYTKQIEHNGEQLTYQHLTLDQVSDTLWNELDQKRFKTFSHLADLLDIKYDKIWKENAEYLHIYILQKNNRVISWAAVEEVDKRKFEVGFWTCKRSRRKGYASQIAKRIKRDFRGKGSLLGDSHDSTSAAFLRSSQIAG